MASPLLLHSTQNWLAYQINERFYGGLHWVWCSPILGPRAVASLLVGRRILAEMRAGRPLSD